MLDGALEGLDRRIASESDHALALRQAPIIQFDAKEPFFPSVVGYTVFRESGPSPSFPREIRLGDGAASVIEYAIWWDWDIQHLYELEHAWVYVDEGGSVVDIEASWHGDYNRMLDEAGQLPLQGGRPLLYSEPGKHAFAPSPRRLLERKAITMASCGVHAGRMGVHVTPLFAGIIDRRKPLQNRLVHTWLERRRFEPSYEFTNAFDLRHAVSVPWPKLYNWIPARVARWTEHLRATIPPHEQRVLRIAHRGASAYARENSAESLRAAAELGADMVEIDIRVSADGVPVVTHDSSLKRIYGIDGDVADYDWESLRELTAAQGGIISFDEALALCKELGLGLYLDIKQLTVTAARAIFAAAEARHYTRNIIYGSFRPDYLADIKAARPDARTSILFNAVDIDPVKLAGAIRADFVHPCWEKRAEQPHRLLTPDWIAAVRAADLGIVCWHEERPAEIAALKALGVDAICSDKPELLKEAPALAS
ncbi:MAG: glycerophosphodiester phosphodiesterase family protein [Chloroflexi bacterium]|nr:glycerophosphodiester phosphodiesterase family protein [Chloroflexota bacterium]